MSKLGMSVAGDVNAGQDNDFSPIPDGWYPIKIVDAQVKDTRAGTGKYISVRMDVTGPNYTGRVLWANYNFMNPSEAAQKIGRAELARLAGACGIDNLEDTDQLIGMQCEVQTKIKRSEEYGDKNEIKGAREGAVKNVPRAAASEIPSFDDDCPF